MTTHIGVLPLDLGDAVTRKVNERVPGLDGPDASTTSFLRLPHPRTALPALFLPYRLAQRADVSSGSEDEWGILEVQSVSPPNQRSWFFMEGEVISDGKLLVMTPIDPAFLLIPILQAIKPNDGSAGLFQPLDDIFDEAMPKIVRSVNERTSEDASPHSISQEDMLFLTRCDCVINALKRICDFQNITPELTVYRYSEDKVIEYLQAKVSRLSKHAVAEKSRTLIRNLAKDGLMDDGKENLLELGRLRMACNLVSQYVTRDVYAALIAKYDFTPLDAHIKALKDQEIANTLAGAQAKKPRAADGVEDDGKKRKAKSKASQGVEKLKKANVSGMSKISSFFQKK
ncbi:ribonuclease H2, subunit B [Russula ochroleuca]|uniref:Ribonuclease H2 subunit B n=1 Tax=Russula ochroleuca TaxID=152965 RepID=A0A9P5N0C2_9AGAM|nr:ribonuclease H2, subunit B [Russula ochroleuca]